MRLRARRGPPNATVFKLCSLLLLYPDEELLEARGDLVAAAGELPHSPATIALRRFGDWWRSEDAIALQQHYVETFDLDRRCCMYLTFYGQGDKRERGLALLRLKRLYRAAGLPLEGGELPDFLPVMLEFAAAAPTRQGEVVLREHRAALELLRESLRERATPYGNVLDAVCLTMGEPSPADRARAVRLAASGPPQELVGLEPFMPPEIVPSAEPSR